MSAAGTASAPSSGVSTTVPAYLQGHRWVLWRTEHRKGVPTKPAIAYRTGKRCGVKLAPSRAFFVLY
jgi:hypothetical protein